MADNFSRQYSHLCPDRVPLFLHPLNECKVPVRWDGEAGGRQQRVERGGPSTDYFWVGAHRSRAAYKLKCPGVPTMAQR